MRIALVTQGFLTGGGVSSITAWLRRELERAGHQVTIHDAACSFRDSRSRRLVVPRTWFRALDGTPDSGDPSLVHWGANWVECEWQRYQPQKRLTEHLSSYDLIQVVAGAPALAHLVSEVSAPKVLQVATTLDQERRTQLPGLTLGRRLGVAMQSGVLRRIERAALHDVDQVVVENRWMEDWVKAQGQSRVVLAPPGIDTGFYKPLGEWNPHGPIIAFGRLNEVRKDWPTAVSAYERFVNRTGSAVNLTLAGKGPLTSQLAHCVESSPLRNRIQVIVDVDVAEVPRLLATGSLFLQSSLEEGLGLAGLEAMACGLPVVATRTEGSSEYVRHEENGYLVGLTEHSAEELSRGIEFVLANGRAMSVAALRTIRERHSSTRALRAFLRIYEELTSASGLG